MNFLFLVSKGEYEGLYADAAEKRVYVLCKSCAVDKNSGQVTGYVLQWNENLELSMESNFLIGTNPISKILGQKKINFRPSALAKNKRDNEWYILSSVNKLLVITDLQWQVKQAISLSGEAFSQPEGMAFDKAGNLYISNERGNLKSASILKFSYTGTKK